MSANGVLEALKQALRRLPGVGPKSAQRMAFYLMERDREGARRIAEALTDALNKITHCKRCNNLSEADLCSICTMPKRDRSLLCIVESPSDLVSLEQSGVYQGFYFVLMGRLSPLDGIGPDEIGVPRLVELLAEGAVKEVVLATNLTVEGEATAQYLSDLVRARGIRATRIAYGVPIGGELEYTDRNTLARALAGRRDA